MKRQLRWLLAQLRRLLGQVDTQVGQIYEYPPIYVSKGGVHYIKPKEFFQSRKGQSMIKQASKLTITIPRPQTSTGTRATVSDE